MKNLKYVIGVLFLVSSVGWASEGSLIREGTSIEISQNEVADLLKWIETAKHRLTHLKNRSRHIRGLEKLRMIRGEFDQIVEQSGKKENELFMRYTLNRIRLLDEIFEAVLNPGELDFLLSIYEDAVTLALELYTEDEAFLAAIGERKKNFEMLSMPEFGFRFMDLILKYLPGVFDPAKEYNIKRALVGFLGNDLNSSRNLLRPLFADVIVGAKDFLHNFKPIAENPASYLKLINRMDFEIFEVLLPAARSALEEGFKSLRTQRSLPSLRKSIRRVGVSRYPEFPKNFKVKNFLETSSPVWSSAFSFDDELLFVGTKTGSVRVYRRDLDGGYQFSYSTKKEGRRSEDGVSNLIVLPGNRLVTVQRYNIKIWKFSNLDINLSSDFSDIKLSSHLKHPWEIKKLVTDPTGERLLIMTESGLIKVLDISSGSVLAEFYSDTEYYDYLGFSPDGSRLAYLVREPRKSSALPIDLFFPYIYFIKVLETTTWNVVRSFTSDGEFERPDGIVFGSNNEVLSVLDTDSSNISMVSLNDGPVKDLSDDGRVRALRFDLNKEYVLFLSGKEKEHTLKIFDRDLKFIHQTTLPRALDWVDSISLGHKNDKMVINTVEGAYVLLGEKT